MLMLVKQAKVLFSILYFLTISVLSNLSYLLLPHTFLAIGSLILVFSCSFGTLAFFFESTGLYFW